MYVKLSMEICISRCPAEVFEPCMSIGCTLLRLLSLSQPKDGTKGTGPIYCSSKYFQYLSFKLEQMHKFDKLQKLIPV